jgi:hypothetical protein
VKPSEDGSLNGSLNIMEMNFAAYETRNKIAKEGKKTYQTEFFTNKWLDAKVESITTKNLGDNTQRLTQTIIFLAENVGQVAGDLMCVDLFMGLGMDENPFKLQYEGIKGLFTNLVGSQTSKVVLKKKP